MIADRMLAAKLRTFQAFGPQLWPKQALSFGLFAAETAAIGTQLFGRAHNNELYRRILKMMGEERSGAEADEESRAEVPLRPVTIFARNHSENRAGPPPPNNGGGAAKTGEKQAKKRRRYALVLLDRTLDKSVWTYASVHFQFAISGISPRCSTTYLR